MRKLHKQPASNVIAKDLKLLPQPGQFEELSA